MGFGKKWLLPNEGTAVEVRHDGSFFFLNPVYCP